MEDKSLFREVGVRPSITFLANIHRLGGGFETDTVNHPTDWLMLSLARQRLRSADSNEFLYLHTKGVHDANEDYRPPPAWRGRVSPSGEDPSERYDDLLGFVDSLWPWLDEAIPDDAVVVVTSDHGVPLGRNGNWYDKRSADPEDQRRVPLWVRGLDFDGEVTHVEVVNEILDIVETDSIASPDRTAEPGRSTEKQLEALGYR